MPVKKRATAASARPALGATGAAGGDGDDEEDLSEGDAPVDEYDDDLYGDESDQARLAAMGELERENLLYERSQRRQEALETRRLKREARARRLGLRGVTTRGAAPAALTGKSARAAALEQIREARQRGATGADRAKAAAARATQALELAGEEDGGDYSEEEEQGRRGRGRGRRRGASVSGSDGELGSEDEDDVQLAGFQDIRQCCVTRQQLEKWVDKPFFEDVLPGCFVRVGTGVGGDGVAVYRMARVAGVASGAHPVTGQELRPYEFGHPAGRRSPKWLLLQHGDQQRAFKMSLVSNAEPQEREFAGWARGEMDAGRKPLRLSDVKARRKAILAADAYRWAAQDVARVLAAKKAATGGPRNVALEKERLAARLEFALQEGDEHTALDCRAALEQLELDIAALLPRGAAAMTSINKRNAQVNIQLIDDSQTAKEAAAKAAAGVTGTNDVDPFSRRPTRVTNYWQTKSKEQQDSEAAAAASAPPALPPPEEEAAPAEPTEAPDPRLLAAAWPPEHPQAAAHRAAYTPLALGRLAGPKILPILAGWTGGLGVADAAIHSGMTLITVSEYRKRLQDARTAQQQQMQLPPPPPQAAYYQSAPLPPPPPPPPMQQQWY